MTRCTVLGQVRQPCLPGYEGKWCVAIYGHGTVWFNYYRTRREAREAAKQSRNA